MPALAEYCEKVIAAVNKERKKGERLPSTAHTFTEEDGKYVLRVELPASYKTGCDEATTFRSEREIDAYPSKKQAKKAMGDSLAAYLHEHHPLAPKKAAAVVEKVEEAPILRKLESLFPTANGKDAMQRALQCPTSTGAPHHGKMAKLGDYCLGVIVARELFDGATDAGELSVLCAARVSNAALHELGLAKGLDKALKKTYDTDLLSQKVLATTIEALIAAAWGEYGEEGAQRVWQMLNT